MYALALLRPFLDDEAFARDVWSCFSCLGCGSCLSCSAWRSLRRPTYNEISQLKTAERARAARGRVPKTRKPSLAESRLCMLLFLLNWLRPFLQLQCSTKPSRETYGLASLASVAALACLAVLGVLCVARFPFHDSQVLCWVVFGSKSGPRRPKSDSN